MCNVVDNNGAVGVAIVHGRERLVALLAGRVPDLKLDCGVLVERDGLGEERGADGGFSERVEWVLGRRSASSPPQHRRPSYLDESQDY